MLRQTLVLCRIHVTPGHQSPENQYRSLEPSHFMTITGVRNGAVQPATPASILTTLRGNQTTRLGPDNTPSPISCITRCRTPWLVLSFSTAIARISGMDGACP